MKSDSVSIIIPIYNEEEHLHRCVQSVISQTHRNLEIILVDDGSTDGSSEICGWFAKQDSRVRVIHQSNQGLSAARNAGLDIATSGYIQFVDSDDWILPTMTEELLEALKEDSSDIVQCDFYRLSEKSELELQLDRSTDTSSSASRKVYRGDDLHLQLTINNVRTVVQWNKIFRRRIFEELRFPVGKLHEDEFVIHRELEQANALSWLDRKLYVYTQNPKSITHQHSLKNSIHVCEAYLDRTRFLLESNAYSAGKTAFVMFLRQLALCERQINSQKDSGTSNLDVCEWLHQIREEVKTIPTDFFS